MEPRFVFGIVISMYYNDRDRTIFERVGVGGWPGRLRELTVVPWTAWKCVGPWSRQYMRTEIPAMDPSRV